MFTSALQSITEVAPDSTGCVRSVLTLGLLVFFQSGCATWQKTHETAVSQFGSANLDVSRDALEKSHQSFRSEKKLLELDQAILELAGGDVAQAEARFRTLRRELEHLEQKELTEQASSLMTDSRAIAWSGRDFERRMILNMALLTSLLHDGQDSFAYSMQITDASAARRTAIAAAAKKADAETGVARLDGSTDVTPVSHTLDNIRNLAASTLDQPLALGTYLAAAVQSEIPSRSLETETAIQEVGFWNPAFRQRDQKTTDAEFGTRCQPGHGTLHVISLVGKAPRWVNESAEPTSTALLIADRIISVAGRHTLPPTIASVKIACPETCGNLLPSGNLKCSVQPAEDSGATAAKSAASGSHHTLDFATLVNLNEVARASYQEHRDEEIGAAIARRVLKKGAVYVLKETQQIHRNSLIDLGVNVAGIAWEAMEKADTRSWRMLPARIDVARTELPAGAWTTRLSIHTPGNPASVQQVPIHIEDGRNTYVVCIIPKDRFTGQILIGGVEQKSIPADFSVPQ